MVNHMIHKRTSFVHATCRVVEENYRRAGFDMDKVKLVYDGVDIKKFNPDVGGGHIRREAGIPDQAPVIANIGRLEAIKGHKYLLEALAILRKRLPGFHMLIAGDGSLRNELEETVTASGLRAQVHFLGVRKNIPEILCASDMYVLCSIGSEGSSRATQEAMACGLPVVATDVGMLPDIVKEGETGFIVPSCSPESMADALYKILSDYSKLKEMGWNSRKWVEEDFDENIFAKRIVDLYSSVI
jgi:glycosyltransferase involved in cell wall biosynthesis